MFFREKSLKISLLGKLLVVSGSKVAEFSTLTEVIDLQNSQNQCQLTEDFELATTGGTGKLLQEKLPLICSGYTRTKGQSDVCYLLGNSLEKAQTFNLLESREYTSSILINPSTLWITGGLHRGDFPIGAPLDSTEYLSLSGEISQEGPKLPYKMRHHCLLNYDENSALLMGGVYTLGAVDRTYFFDFASSEWTPGPKMTIDRWEFGCTKIEIGGKKYAVAAGGYSTAIGSLSSVEFLDLTDENSQWVEGPSLPYELMEFQFVTSGNGKEAFAVGGISGRDFQSAILRLSCQDSVESCQWELMEQKLQVARKEHVAMLIPDDLVTCSM